MNGNKQWMFIVIGVALATLIISLIIVGATGKWFKPLTAPFQKVASRSVGGAGGCGCGAAKEPTQTSPKATKRDVVEYAEILRRDLLPRQKEGLLLSQQH